MAQATLKNVTFSLPPELVEKLKSHVIDLELPSINAAVREAIESYVQELDNQKFRLAMQTAVKDPRFMQDLEEGMRDFSYADKEDLDGKLSMEHIPS